MTVTSGAWSSDSCRNKFDTLTTSISQGLLKENELRKQFKYYLDLLLGFPSLRAAGEATQKNNTTR